MSEVRQARDSRGVVGQSVLTLGARSPRAGRRRSRVRGRVAVPRSPRRRRNADVRLQRRGDPRSIRAPVAALRGVPHRIHYSVKANSNLAILRLLQ